MRKRRLISAGALVAVAALVAACGTPADRHHLVLPIHFRGDIAVVVKRDASWFERLRGESFLHAVPSDGVICHDVNPGKFRLSAAFADGSPIHTEQDPLPQPPDAGAIRLVVHGLGWGDGGGVAWLTVGDASAVADGSRRFFGGYHTPRVDPLLRHCGFAAPKDEV